MTVLVTGGAGYIGSVVAAQLVEAGHRVVVYDKRSRNHRRAVPQGLEWVIGDLSDRSGLERLFRAREVDAVMHFAGLIDAGESVREPAKYFRTNVCHTLSLLEAMLSCGTRTVVFSSSAAVYGNPKRIPIEETDALCPTNPYGESKLLVERMLDWFHRIHGLRYASLRYFNAAGASGELGEDHRPESHLIPLLMKVALGQKNHISVFGADYPTPDGTCIRDYVHVADLAAAHLLALEALKQHPRLVYNVGSGRGFSVRQVIELARRVTGHPIPAVATSRRPGDPAILVASCERIQHDLSWRPKYCALETIVASAWDWHRQHPNGYAECSK